MEQGGATGSGNAGTRNGVVGGGKGKRSGQRKKSSGSENAAGILVPVGRTARNQRNDNGDVVFSPPMRLIVLEEEKKGRLLAFLVKMAVWACITAVISKRLLFNAGVGNSGELRMSERMAVVYCYALVAGLVRGTILTPLCRIATRITGARDAHPPALRVRGVYTCRLGFIRPNAGRYR